LFVENHAVFAQTVVEEFLAGFDVIIAPSLAEGRRQLAAKSFEAVLVDFDLDDGKGDELVTELRVQGIGGRIVAVSAHAEGNAALLAAGADAVCPKGQFREIRRALEGRAPEL
jgi:DNA-binding response OmpR family regulator